MTSHRRGWKKALVGVAIFTAGLTLWLPSCSGLLTTFNPCGTIFSFCTPEQINQMFGTIPDWNLDPTCTIPYYGINGDSPGTCGTDNVYATAGTPGTRPDGQQ